MTASSKPGSTTIRPPSSQPIPQRRPRRPRCHRGCHDPIETLRARFPDRRRPARLGAGPAAAAGRRRAAAGSAAGPAAGQAPYPGQPAGTVGGPPAPVVFVTSVEVLRSDRDGGLDVVRVRGVVTGQSWSQPHLIPITQGQPRDGMLDLIFQASAPAGAAGLGPFMPVEAILPVETGHPYKGVRVRGGNNAISLKASRATPRRRRRRKTAPSASASSSSPRAPIRRPARPPTTPCARPTCPTRCASSSRPTAFRATRWSPTG